jgi:hypothetical protein
LDSSFPAFHPLGDAPPCPRPDLYPRRGRLRGRAHSPDRFGAWVPCGSLLGGAWNRSRCLRAGVEVGPRAVVPHGRLAVRTLGWAGGAATEALAVAGLRPSVKAATCPRPLEQRIKVPNTGGQVASRPRSVAPSDMQVRRERPHVTSGPWPVSPVYLTTYHPDRTVVPIGRALSRFRGA